MDPTNLYMLAAVAEIAYLKTTSVRVSDSSLSHASKRINSQTSRDKLNVDHDYCRLPSLANRVECPILDDDDEKSNDSGKEVFRCVKRQFVINTPSYPYVHKPVSLEVSRIEEFDASGNPVSPYKKTFRKCVKNSDHTRDHSAANRRIESGSVLGCVENRVKFQSGAQPMPHTCDLLMEENDENSENIEHLAITSESAKNSKVKKRKRCDRNTSDDLLGAGAVSLTNSSSNPKEIKCHICDRSFTRKSSLNYHLLVHSNESRFSCDYPGCAREFRHRSHFRNHVADHNGPHICPVCSESFRTFNSFKKHKKDNHAQVLTSSGFNALISHSSS